MWSSRAALSPLSFGTVMIAPDSGFQWSQLVDGSSRPRIPVLGGRSYTTDYRKASGDHGGACVRMPFPISPTARLKRRCTLVRCISPHEKCYPCEGAGRRDFEMKVKTSNLRSLLRWFWINGLESARPKLGKFQCPGNPVDALGALSIVDSKIMSKHLWRFALWRDPWRVGSLCGLKNLPCEGERTSLSSRKRSVLLVRDERARDFGPRVPRDSYVSCACAF